MDAICESTSERHGPFSHSADASRPRRSLIIDTRAVLGVDVCRTLWRMGWLVDVFALRGSPAFLSRGCHRRFICRDFGPTYLSDLSSIIEHGGYKTIYLCSEEILELLVASGNSGRWPALPLSEPRSLKAALSKSAMIQLAQRAGVPVPRTVVPTRFSEVLESANQIGFPLVIKGDAGEAARNVRYANDPDQLLGRYQQMISGQERQQPPPALQEFIPGAAYSIGGLFQDGRPLRIYAYRKLFSYPPTGGLTAKTVTERPTELLNAAFAIFAELRYTGLGQMQFIRDARDGRFKFLEINPRVWGCIGLAPFVGVDLHTPYATLARGGRVLPDLKYQTGVMYHRFSVELRLVATRPSQLPRLLRDCFDPRVCSDFSWRDPGPHLPSPSTIKALISRHLSWPPFVGTISRGGAATHRLPRQRSAVKTPPGSGGPA